MKVKKKVKRSFLIVAIIIVILGLGVGGYIVYRKFSKSVESASTKVEKEITDYGYVLEDDASKEYKKLFDELVKVLSNDEVDEEEYAKLVAELLVFDFYNLDDKLSKNDIGGTQFILSDYRDEFVFEASETVYKYIEHNIYGDREQELPVVKSVLVSDIRTSSYEYNDFSDDNVYVVTVKVTYEKDLDYPEEVTVKMLHNDKKLEVFYMK